MAVDVLLGLQWGDEGKGKVVDYLAEHYDMVSRFQGGPNAGHTLYLDGEKYVLHTIPSGIFRGGIQNLIGNGVVIDPITLAKELEMLEKAGVPYQERLLVARKAHLILPTHRYLDAASEVAKGKEKIGSTLRGIGPTYMDKTGRNGIRVGDISLPEFEEVYNALKEKHLGLLRLYPEFEYDLKEEEAKWFDSLEVLRKLKHVNGEYVVNKALRSNKRVLAEGAQGSMLDIDFGTYPFVTSSNTITAGVCTGLGVSPSSIGEVIGITKAYCTRVGSGPFPTELEDEMGELLRKEGKEFGATTGRPRRCGWIDLPQLKYTIMLNGVTQLIVTKVDVLNNFDHIKCATAYSYQDYTGEELPYDLARVQVEPKYETHSGWQQSLEGVPSFSDLPEAAQLYIQALENQLEVPVKMISVGPERDQILVKGK